MKSLKHKLFSSACGVSGGLAGLLSLSRCYGNGCSSCFGCVGAGAGILVVMLFTRVIHKFKLTVPDPLLGEGSKPTS